MKVKCCSQCVVDAMCTVGCKQLWIYYNLLEQKSSKYFKNMRICLNSMIVFSIGHGLMVLTGFSVPSESHGYYTIEYLGLTYWYWWFIVIYMIPFVGYLYFMTHRILVKKIIIKINTGGRSSFISHKKFEEAVEENKRKHGGGVAV